MRFYVSCSVEEIISVVCSCPNLGATPVTMSMFNNDIEKYLREGLNTFGHQVLGKWEARVRLV